MWLILFHIFDKKTIRLNLNDQSLIMLVDSISVMAKIYDYWLLYKLNSLKIWQNLLCNTIND